MVTTAILIAALAGIWSWREVAQINQRLSAFDGFEGMHFEG